MHLFKWKRFPHAVFFPNIFNNYYIINECARIRVPTFGLTDTIDSPSNLFFPIPGNPKSLKPLILIHLLINRSYFYAKINKSCSFLFNLSKRIFWRTTRLRRKLRRKCRLPRHLARYYRARFARKILRLTSKFRFKKFKKTKLLFFIIRKLFLNEFYPFVSIKSLIFKISSVSRNTGRKIYIFFIKLMLGFERV